MTAKLLSGRAIAETVRAELREMAAAYQERHGRAAGLAVVTVGGRPASDVYVRQLLREAGACRCAWRSGRATR